MAKAVLFSGSCSPEAPARCNAARVEAGSIAFAGVQISANTAPQHPRVIHEIAKGYGAQLDPPSDSPAGHEQRWLTIAPV